MLPTTFFQANRQALVKKVSTDALIIITANGLMQRSSDTAFAFRQDSNFFYLTGITEPNVALVIDTASGAEFLILPQQTEVERYFGGALDQVELAKKSGITVLHDHQSGWQELKQLLSKTKLIKTLLAPPVQFTRQERMFTSPARRLLIQKLRRLTKLPIEGLYAELIELRQIKQPAEIAAIKRSIEITKAGFEAARSMIVPGMYEYEIEAVFDAEFKRRQATHGYTPPIIAAGKNATTLHYSQGKSQLQSGDFLLMDVGAEFDCYGADISRTYSVDVATPRQQAVYKAVKSVQMFAQDILKPGLAWRDYALKVDEAIGQELLKLKLITSNTRQQVRPFFPHGISHSLGLDTHDICDYKEIQEGMVITVEPGIYIPEEGIGVRIEDDILITKNGVKNLSSSITYQ